ncbi:MAG: hypothetical protein FWE43_04605 [Streptococcaceae bacterium]|nr:hypothetical protein [Streptococcaceae bacterium]MCL2681751.1 hypothetical protein [Streptococcaceae bacterium]
MLTDRQQKFNNDIRSLLLFSSSATIGEREYLKNTAEDLEKGNLSFKRIIDKLILNLLTLEQYSESGLSNSTKKLLDDLISTYGIPEKNKNSVDWKISDPEYVFVGGYGAWQKRGTQKKPVYKLVLMSLLRTMFVLGVLYVVFPLMKDKLGKNYELGVACFGIILMIVLVIFGRKGKLKRPSQINKK